MSKFTLDEVQDVTAAKELVRSPAVLQAGIHYLEHEFVQVTTPGGRTWNVYGSPVSDALR